MADYKKYVPYALAAGGAFVAWKVYSAWAEAKAKEAAARNTNKLANEVSVGGKPAVVSAEVAHDSTKVISVPNSPLMEAQASTGGHFDYTNGGWVM